MPILIHLALEKHQDRIRRAGLRASRTLWPGVPRGVHAMPMLEDFWISHQWLRELRRGGSSPLCAIDVRLARDERVFVGHYGQAHQELSLGTAIGTIRRHPDPRGFEIIVPRSIDADEIHRVRKLRQLTGWRVFPDAKGKKPCACDYCQRGLIKGARMRASAGA